MHRVRSKEREAFISKLAKEAGLEDETAAQIARRILRWSTTYARIQEAYCCREVSKYEERQEERAERLIREACGSAGTVWQVARDDQAKYAGTEQECWAYLHSTQPHSIDHATKYEGWTLQEVPRIDPVFSGDPRGATVKLRVASGYCDDWGQTGLCVPTS